MQTSSSNVARIDSIDQFRGLAIILMIIANYLFNIDTVPGWLKHAKDIGLTFTDLIAPFFIFAIGLTYGPSVRRRAQRDGELRTFEHVLRRSLVLIGIGSLLATGQQWAGVDGSPINWGVLQSIGAAVLLSYPALRLPFAAKFAVAALVLAAYQLTLDSYLLPFVLAAPQGGLPASFSWAAMLLLSSALADLFHTANRRRLFPYAAVIVAVAGLALAIVAPISKNRVSASYVVLATGLSACLYWIFHLLVDPRARRRSPAPGRSSARAAAPDESDARAAESGLSGSRLLRDWGMNPLILYVLQGFLDAIFMLPQAPWWYSEAPVWVIIPQLLALLAAMSIAAALLRRRNYVFSL